jgi:3D (Asp-Asp-Asp) domain-containing protein
MRNAFAAVVALLALGLTACAGPTPAEAAPMLSPAPVAAPSVAPTTAAAQAVRQQVEVTFYAAADNDPPGSAEIAYPNSRHTTAAGTGTYADPLSLATDPREIRPGVLVYYPAVKKYFVMEDDCAECIDDWSTNRTPHVDLWMSNTSDPAVQGCEAALTPDAPDTIIVNPPADLPVDLKPLYAGGKCWPGT